MSLLAWLPLSGEYSDRMRNYSVSASGTLTSSADGRIGNDCYEFSSGSGTFSCERGDNLLTNNKYITFSFWARLSATSSTVSTTYQAVLSSGSITSTDTSYWVISLNSAALTLNGTTLITIGSELTGDWHHYAIRVENFSTYSTVEVYMDCELKATITTDSMLSFASSVTAIDVGGQSSWIFEGSLQDVRIYDEWISEREIWEIYTAPVCHYSCYINELEINDVITDESGIGNDATIEGTAPTFSDHSYKLSGAGYLSIPSTANLYNYFTVNLWAYSDDWSGTTVGRLVSMGSTSAGWAIGQYNSSTTTDAVIYFHAYTSAGTICNLSTTLSGSGWKMFTLVYDGGLFAYVDGELLGSVTESLTSVVAPIFIGAQANGSSVDSSYPSYSSASIRNFTIYGTPLSATEIAGIYKTAASVHNTGAVSIPSLQESYISTMATEGTGGEFSSDSLENLIYNGDFWVDEGTNGWDTDLITLVTDSSSSYKNNAYFATPTNFNNGTADSTHFIPVNREDEYELSFYSKTWDGLVEASSFCIGIVCFDKDFNEILTVEVNHPNSSAVCTSSTSLVNGSTTSLTINSTDTFASGINSTTGYVGIMTYFYDTNYERAAQTLRISAASANTLTLSSTYSGTNVTAPFYVRYCETGDTYLFPFDTTFSTYNTTDWSFHSTTIGGSSFNQFYFDTKYIKIYLYSTGGSGINGTPLIKELTLKNITRAQRRKIIQADLSLTDHNIQTFSVKKEKIGETDLYSEIETPVRYIRDTLGAGGSSSSTNAVWVQIEALDRNGTNIAAGADVTVPSGASLKNCDEIRLTSVGMRITDTDLDTASWVAVSASTADQNVIVDLGAVYDISELIIYHYGDGRTFVSNITEISVDGENWIEVFNTAIEGTYAEARTGHTIELTPSIFSIGKDGMTKAHKINEK